MNWCTYAPRLYTNLHVPRIFTNVLRIHNMRAVAKNNYHILGFVLANYHLREDVIIALFIAAGSNLFFHPP